MTLLIGVLISILLLVIAVRWQMNRPSNHPALVHRIKNATADYNFQEVQRKKEVFYAGAHAVPITSKDAVYMAGLDADRKSVGVHDDIYARCLILSQDDETVAFVALDLLGFSNEKVNDIVQIIQSIPGNFVDNVVIASTHCHSAPDVIGAWGPTIGEIPYRSGVDSDYLAQLYRGIVESIYLAAKNLRPAKLKFGSAMIPESSHVSKNIRDKNIIDREVTAMQVELSEIPQGGAVSVDGKVIATLVNYACHPEVCGRTTIWTWLQLVRVNNILFLATPCDFSGELALQVKEYADKQGFQAIVTSFNGDYIGYVVPDRYYELDHYETRWMSVFGPHNGSYFVALMRRMIDEVNAAYMH